MRRVVVVVPGDRFLFRTLSIARMFLGGHRFQGRTLPRVVAGRVTIVCVFDPRS